MKQNPLFISKNAPGVKTDDGSPVIRIGTPFEGDLFEIKMSDLKGTEKGKREKKKFQEIFDKSDIQVAEDMIEGKGVKEKEKEKTAKVGA